PRLAADAAVAVALLGRRAQVVVERDEVERRADPRDRRDDVQPAEEEVAPVPDVVHGARRQRSCAIETSSCSAVSSSSSRPRSIRSRRIGRISDFGRRLTKTTRSEEHTSELQSRFDLVCRLLLEKKNRYKI